MSASDVLFIISVNFLSCPLEAKLTNFSPSLKFASNLAASDDLIAMSPDICDSKLAPRLNLFDRDIMTLSTSCLFESVQVKNIAYETIQRRFLLPKCSQLSENCSTARRSYSSTNSSMSWAHILSDLWDERKSGGANWSRVWVLGVVT